MEAPELQLLFDTSRFDCDGLPSFNLIHPHPHGQPDPSQNLWNKAGAIEDIAVDKTLQSTKHGTSIVSRCCCNFARMAALWARSWDFVPKVQGASDRSDLVKVWYSLYNRVVDIQPSCYCFPSCRWLGDEWQHLDEPCLMVFYHQGNQ